MTYVLIPGAWVGGWVWDAVAKGLRQAGHVVHALTLPGLGGESDPQKMGLATHVDFVRAFIASSNLQDVVLVGHSYSGMIVGHVATMNEGRVRHSVFVEAFLPIDGKSMLDVSGLDVALEESLIDENGGLWPAPTREDLEGQLHLTEESIALLVSKQKDHPGRTVMDKAKLAGQLTMVPATFISEAEWLSTSREAELVQMLRACDHWDFKVLCGGHWPMLAVPEELTAVLLDI